jgi:hypothetical protein
VVGAMDWDWLGIVLGLVALVCVCLPCKYDPAIRIKEWLDAMDKETDCDSGLEGKEGGDDH